MRRPLFALTATTLIACGPPPLPNFGDLNTEARTVNVKLDIRMFEMGNGMRVAMVPDARTNLVSIDVRYAVGSNQDPSGKAGLAHLVEHLAFQVPGTKPDVTIYDQLSSLALTFNAYTTHDVTHYTATALANRVDALLELEARRLETPCKAIAAAAFTRERDVVLEEEAERASPWATAFAEIEAAAWGRGHPYGRPVGTREVAAATQADACAFFDRYYTPNRALMVVSGNFNPDALQPRIGRRFGPIHKTSDVPKVLDPVEPARLVGTRSKHVADVERPTVVIELAAPPWGSDDEVLHEATLAAIAGELDDLDNNHAWIVDTGVGYGGDSYQRTTLLAIEVSDAKHLDDAATAALGVGARVLADDDEDGNADDNDDDDDRAVANRLAALRGSLQTGTITANDRFWGKGATIADYLTFTDHLEFAFPRMRATDALKGNAIVARARELLDPARVHVAFVTPSGKATRGQGAAAAVAASSHAYDLPTWRTPVDGSAADRPEPLPPEAPALDVEDFRLVNGLRVLLYAEPGSLGFDARLVFPRGMIDERDDTRGVARLAANLLDHDYGRSYPLDVYEKIAWALQLGTRLGAYAGDAVTVFSSRGLAMHGDWHLWRLAWLIDQGVYSGDDLAAMRRALAERGDDDRSPSGLAFQERLFGRGHPYAQPPPGATTLAAISAAQLRAWRRNQLGLDGATLIVSGGFDRDAMHRHVVSLFGAIGKRTPPARAAFPPAKPTAGPSWIGTRLDTAQVQLYVSFAATSHRERDRAARRVLEAMIEDRLRVIREGMGATYGVSSGYDERAAGSTLDLTTALDPDRAPRAATAVLASLASLRSDPRAAAQDFVRARRRLVSNALASSIDIEAVANRLEWAVRHGGDRSAADREAVALAEVTLDAVAAVAAVDLDPARMVVSVDGRAEPVKATLEALGATDVAWFDK